MAKVMKKSKPSLNETPKAEEVKEAKKEKKSGKPTIDGASEPKEVKKKEKRTTVIPPPPMALPFIGEVINPLLTDTRCKRALCVALARSTTDDDALIEAVRISGVCQKAGMGKDKLDTGALSKNEFSGRGYALRCGRKLQKTFDNAKAAVCLPFAKALLQVVEDKSYDKVREAATAKYEEWKNTPDDPKPKKSNKAGKPTIEDTGTVKPASPAPEKKKKVLKREKPSLTE